MTLDLGGFMTRWLALFTLTFAVAPAWAAPVALPAAHVTFEAPQGWMVMPSGAAVAMTKIGSGTSIYAYPAEGQSVDDGKRAVEAMFPNSGAALSRVSLPSHKGRAAEVTGIDRLFGFPTRSRGYFLWSPHGDAVLLLAFGPKLGDDDVALVRQIAQSVRFEPVKDGPAVAIELGGAWDGVQVTAKAPAGYRIAEQEQRAVSLARERPTRALRFAIVLGDTGGMAGLLERSAAQSGLILDGKPRKVRGGLWAPVSLAQQGQTLPGHLGVRKLNASTAVVAVILGRTLEQAELLKLLSSAKALRIKTAPAARSAMKRLGGSRISFLESSSSSIGGYSGSSTEIVWELCSDGSYSYYSNVSNAFSGGAGSASARNRSSHEGRWLVRANRKGALTLELATTDGETFSVPIELGGNGSDTPAVVNGQRMKFWRASDDCE